MKNLISLSTLVFLLLLGTKSFAQIFGIKAGVNLSNMLVKDSDNSFSDDFKMNLGFHFGPTMELPIGEIFSFESGLLLSTKGFKQPEKASLKVKWVLLYLDIPLTAKVSFDIGGAKVYTVFGPQIGMGLSGKIKTELIKTGENVTAEEDISWGSNRFEGVFKRLDFGLTMGAGVEFNSIQIGINYGFGLANISADTTNGKIINNRVLGISLGYKFGGEIISHPIIRK